MTANRELRPIAYSDLHIYAEDFERLTKYHPHLYEINTNFAQTSHIATEIQSSRANAFAGSWPKLILTPGSSKDRFGTASGVTQCKIWYIDGANDLYTVKTQNLPTTSYNVATIDNSAAQYNDHWNHNWTGLFDPTSSIRVTASSATQTFGTISAGNNETVNTRLWIAKYWRARVRKIRLSRAASLTSAGVTSCDVLVYPLYYISGDQDQDLKKYVSTSDGGPEEWEYPFGYETYGSDDTRSRLTWYMQSLDQRYTTTWNVHIELIMWSTRTKGSFAIVET